MGGDTGERWLRSRIFARDWSVTDRRAGRPNVLSQFAPIADIWRTKAEVRKGPTTDINRWGIPKAAESCTRAARAFKGGKGISAPEIYRGQCGRALAEHGARAYSAQQMARNCAKPKVY